MAGVPQIVVRSIVADERSGVFLFALHLTEVAATPVSVAYATGTVTAASGFDFTPASGTVTFAPGETDRTISVAIADDSTAETPESFRLVFTNPIGAILPQPIVYGTIIDNDRSERAPVASIGDAVVNEADGVARVTIILDRAASTAVEVAYQTVDGSAVGGTDFASTSATANFAPGQTAVTIAIPLVDDAVAEGERQFQVVLTGITGANGAALGNAAGTVAIGRSDQPTAATPTLSVADITVGEGEFGLLATFVLRLSAPSDAIARVNYATATVTASSGFDFEPVSGVVTFAPGETVRTVSVVLDDDSIVEMAESFRLNFSTPEGLTLLAPYALATIIDNDRAERAPMASVSGGAANEGDGYARFTITLDRAATVPVTVTYQTADISAASGGDYVATSGTIGFAPGETARTVAVQIIDDTEAEAEERFALELTGIAGVTGAGLATARGVMAIGRSDGPAAATPALTVDRVVVGEGSPGQVARFTFRLSAPAASLASVTYATATVTAASGFDFEPASGTITFAPGETIRTLDIVVNDDAGPEAAESFRLNLTNPVGLSLAEGHALATIVDNDRAERAPLAGLAGVAVNEASPYALFVLTLDRAATTAVTVGYQTADGTALAGSDYVAQSGSVTFGPGETARTIAVALIDDDGAEGDEVFHLDLTGISGANGAGLVDGRATALIARNDGAAASTPVLTVDGVVVGEGTGGLVAEFLFRLDAPAATVASVGYATASVTASSGFDFEPVSGTISFAPGETLRTVRVVLNDDATVEPAETFRLNLSAPVGLALAQSHVLAGIIDNDRSERAPLARVGDAVVNEADGFARFTITLDRAATTPIAVAYRTVDGTAVSGADYTALSGSVTFAPGETSRTIAVAILDDTGDEGAEAFDLALTGIGGATGAGLADPRGSATIGASDTATAATPTLAVDDVIAGEDAAGQRVTFTLRLSAPSATLATVAYATASETAASGFDFEPTAGTIAFAPGETVKTVAVVVNDDAAVESAETFRLAFSAPSGLALQQAFATATLVDNDATTTSALSLAAANATQPEGTGVDTDFTFTVTRTGDTARLSSAAYAVTGGAIRPVDAADFVGGVLPGGTVTFLPGETAKTIAVKVAGDAQVEGHETFTVTLAHPSEGTTIATATASATIEADDTIVDLVVFNNTLSRFVTPAVRFYDGPVPALEKEFIDFTPDNLTMFTSGPNWFLHSGSGDDAIAVSGGTNVLDGGTGSNFLTGAGGQDTFFVDARGAPGPIWSTVNQFGPGDAATLWGISETDFAINWVDGQGAGGFTGLTLHATAPGQPNVSLTLVGFDIKAKDSGALGIVFGIEPVSGSSYMYIVAN